MALTKKFGLILPAKIDAEQLEAKFFSKILAHAKAGKLKSYKGNFDKWVDPDEMITNSVTGQYWYPFPVGVTLSQLKTFAETLGLSDAKLAYLKNNTGKLDKSDADWFG